MEQIPTPKEQNPAVAAAPVGFAAVLGGFLASIGLRIINVIFGNLWRAFLGLWSILTMTMFHAVNRLFPKQAAWLWKQITDAYYTMPAEWATPIANYIERMTGAKITIADISGGAFQISGAIGAKFLYPMLNLVLPGSDVDPTATVPREAKLRPIDGLRGAENFLGANLHFQMSAWLLHVLGDMQSFGMFKSLKDLPNAISWSYGLGWLSWLVMGVPFRMGISEPLEAYFKRMYRPEPLTRSMIINAMLGQFITWEAGLERLRYLGWGEEEIATILNLEADKLSSSEAREMVRRGFMNEDTLTLWYRRRGHSIIEAETLAATAIDEGAQSLREQCAREALDNYKDRIFTWTDTEHYLNAAYFTPEEKLLSKVLADMRRIPKPPKAPTETSLTAAQIGARYKEKYISLTEARSLLVALPYQADQIDLFLNYYSPDVPKVEEPKEISAAVVGGLYKRGEMSEAQLRRDLVALGYEGWGIERLVLYYKPVPPPLPKVLPPRELTAAIVFQLHEEGHIGTTEAIQRLVALRIREADARLVLTTLHPLKPPEEQPPRVLPATVAGGLYREGAIDSREAMFLFQAAGYDLEGAQYLELYYRPVVKPPPPEIPPRELSATWVFTLHEEGHITTAAAVERLTRLEIRSGDARLLLEKLHPRKADVVLPSRVVPASIVGSLYHRGLIDAGQAVDMFMDSGYDVEGAGYLELNYRPDVPVPVEPLPPRALTPEWVLRLHKEGHLTTEDATARLVDLRFVEEDATLLLTTLYAVPSPAVQVPRALPAGTVGSLYRQELIPTSEAMGLWAVAGYDEKGVAYLELLYRPAVPVPEVVLPPSELSVGWVGTLHEMGAITTPDAVERLGRLRIRPEDAQLILLNMYPRVPVEEQATRALSVPVVGGLYRQGVIDQEEATALFQVAGYDASGAAYLALFYTPTPPTPVPPIALRPSEYARLIASGVLAWGEGWGLLRPFFANDQDALLFIHFYIPGTLPPETMRLWRGEQLTEAEAMELLRPFFRSDEQLRAWTSTF